MSSDNNDSNDSELSEEEGHSLEDLQVCIEELEEQLAEAEDRRLRAAAELRNYRRRITQQQAQQLQYAHEQLVTALVPILDHMELALESAREEDQPRDEVIAGVEMIHRQLFDTLQQFGLRRVDTVGEEFDPRLHEAIERRAMEDEGLSEGEIIEEIRPGYRLNDRVVRPAEVCVCIRPEKAAEDEASK